jgi:hypothetical protein
MAAGSSKFQLSNRGASQGQGAKAQREGLAPSPSFGLYVPTIDSLEEICGWLGTFQERLRAARTEERGEVAAVLSQLEARYQRRRAELS